MLSEPRSGRLAAWGNALLAGLVSPDDAVLAIVGEDAVHRVEGLPGESGARRAHAGARAGCGRSGRPGCGSRCPLPGHPLGLSGPPEFNARALEAEEAVVCHGARARARARGDEAGPAGDVHVEVVWHCLPVREAPPADVPSLGRGRAGAGGGAAGRDGGAVAAGRGRVGAGRARRRSTRTGRGRSGGGRCWRRGIRRGRCGCWSWRSGWGCWSSVAYENGHGGRGERVGDRGAGGGAAAGGADGSAGAGGGVQRRCGGAGAGGCAEGRLRWAFPGGCAPRPPYGPERALASGA